MSDVSYWATWMFAWIGVGFMALAIAFFGVSVDKEDKKDREALGGGAMLCIIVVIAMAGAAQANAMGTSLTLQARSDLARYHVRVTDLSVSGATATYRVGNVVCTGPLVQWEGHFSIDGDLTKCEVA